MASEADQGERTEEPTPQRREDFRKRGQVAQTKELSSVFLLFSAALMIWLMSRFFFQQIGEIFAQTYGDGLVTSVRTGDWKHLAGFAFVRLGFILAPAMGVFWIIGMLGTVVQVGFLHNEDALQIKWERLDPVEGFGRMFSLRAVVEGIKAVIKMMVILTIAYFLLKDQFSVLPTLMSYSTSQIMSFLGALMIRLMLGVGVFMFCLAAFDYLYQRWDLEKQMRMTKQEIKEEVKSREGDPLIKARIKRVQRELASKRMMEEVPKADVIVTNPTHIAIALKYDDTMVAPTIIAKGADLIAERIRELAREHSIPIVENKPLARTMFKTLKIGQAIPRELYTAVAEVLSYVFRLRKKVRR